MNRKFSTKLVREIIRDNDLDVRLVVFPDGGFRLTGEMKDIHGIHEILRGMGIPVLTEQDTALVIA